MNGGYVMVDGYGLNFLNSASQTLPGIHTELKKALQTGKPVILYNCGYGEYQPRTPISATMFYTVGTNERISLVVAKCTVTVTNADVCTKSIH